MRQRWFDGKLVKIDRIDTGKGLNPNAVLQVVHQDPKVAGHLAPTGKKYEGLCVRSQCFPEWRNGELFLRGTYANHNDAAFIVPAGRLSRIQSALEAMERELSSKDGEVVELDGRKYRLSLVQED